MTAQNATFKTERSQSQGKKRPGKSLENRGMDSQALIVLYVIFVQFLQRGLALRCRSRNQQREEQFQDVIQLCKRRPFGNTLGTGDSDSIENDSDNSSFSFDEGTFSKKSAGRNSGAYPLDGGQSLKDQYHGYRKNDRSGRDKHSFDSGDGRAYQWNNMNGSNYSMNRYDTGSSMYNKRGSFSSNQGRATSNGAMDQSSNFDNNDTELEEGCVIQCFFEELNAVDQRGFPERQLVTRLMIQNIHDPELRDFIKESITECFRFLNSDVRKEKCTFSQNLASCLTDKAKERCDDWDDSGN